MRADLSERPFGALIRPGGAKSEERASSFAPDHVNAAAATGAAPRAAARCSNGESAGLESGTRRAEMSWSLSWRSFRARGASLVARALARSPQGDLLRRLDARCAPAKPASQEQPLAEFPSSSQESARSLY